MKVQKIELSEEEKALWDEVGSRGDAFREAVRQRQGEQLRSGGVAVEVDDENGTAVAEVFPRSLDPNGVASDSADKITDKITE